jgi:hypothetical protein
MIASSIENIKGDTISIRIQKVNPSVNIIDENDIPEDFMRTIPAKVEPDKINILKHFKETGEIISGVDILTDKKTVVIR